MEKAPLLGKMEGRRRTGRQRMRGLEGIIHSGPEFEQGLGDGGGQGSLACCSPWGSKESESTEQMNNLLNVHAESPSSSPSKSLSHQEILLLITVGAPSCHFSERGVD